VSKGAQDADQGLRGLTFLTTSRAGTGHGSYGAFTGDLRTFGVVVVGVLIAVPLGVGTGNFHHRKSDPTSWRDIIGCELVELLAATPPVGLAFGPSL